MRLSPMIESQNCRAYSAWDEARGYHYIVEHPAGVTKCATLEEADKVVAKIEEGIALLNQDDSLKGEIFNIGKEFQS